MWNARLDESHAGIKIARRNINNLRYADDTTLVAESPECSLEGLMLKVKFQHFGHLMQRTDSSQKSLMLGKIEGGRRRGQQRMSYLDGIIDSIGGGFGWTPGVGDGQGSLECCSSWGRKESDTTERLNWTELICRVRCRIHMPFTLAKKKPFCTKKILERFRWDRTYIICIPKIMPIIRYH